MQVITQAKFTESPLGKELEKQTKLIKDKKEKYVEVGLDTIFSDQTISEIKNNMNEFWGYDQKTDQWNKKLWWQYSWKNKVWRWYW